MKTNSFTKARSSSSTHDHDQGLAHDLKRLAAMRSRRQILGLLAGASLIPIFGCGDGTTTDNSTGASGNGSGSSTGSGANPSSCAAIPEETAGPYPGDASNGPNALALSGIVRSDIRASIGTASGVAAGVPMTLKLTLVNTNDGCAPLAGYAIYAWHCDRDGSYSMYTIATENYLRGVQETDESGTVTFVSIFPGCYSGRYPHVHFEIYPSLAKATTAGNKVKTSQLALPAEVCNVVYQSTGYSKSLTNLAQTSLAKDMVFSDGSSLQVATTEGSVAAGYVASLTIGIAV